MKTVLTFTSEQPEVLSVLVELSPTSADTTQLIRQSRGTGYLVWGNQFARWEARGQAVREGIALQAPWPWENPTNFQSLNRDQMKAAPVELWSALIFLCDKMESSEQNSMPDLLVGALLPFQASGQFGWLFLPPIREKLAALATDSERAAWRPLLHPDYRGSASWQFFLSSCLLERSWGHLPWADPDETKERQALRGWANQKAERWLVGADQKFKTLLSSAWKGQPQPWSTWQDWLATSATSNTQFSFPPLLEQAWQRKQQRQQFWRQKGTLIFGISAVVVAVASFLIAFLGPLLGPHPEDSWSRSRVVRGYYQAWNDMDSQTLSHLVRDDGGTSVLKADHERLASEFVLRQVRMAYEHRNPFESPQKWIAAGKPVLPVGQFVRGDIDLKFQELTPFVWQAQYQQWVSVPHQKESAVPQPSLILGSQVTDKLTLAKTSRGWKIVRIERVREPLP